MEDDEEGFTFEEKEVRVRGTDLSCDVLSCPVLYQHAQATRPC